MKTDKTYNYDHNNQIVADEYYIKQYNIMITLVITFSTRPPNSKS